VWVVAIARLGLKVKDTAQGQMLASSAHGRDERRNAVGLTSILDRGQFF